MQVLSRLGGVHALQLRVTAVQLLQRSDCQELAAPAEAHESDGRIEETVDVQSVHVLGRAVRSGEREVALQQLANVPGAGRQPRSRHRAQPRTYAIRCGPAELQDQNPSCWSSPGARAG